LPSALQWQKSSPECKKESRNAGLFGREWRRDGTTPRGAQAADGNEGARRARRPSPRQIRTKPALALGVAGATRRPRVAVAGATRRPRGPYPPEPEAPIPTLRAWPWR
jgi:hypothetical protein